MLAGGPVTSAPALRSDAVSGFLHPQWRLAVPGALQHAKNILDLYYQPRVTNSETPEKGRSHQPVVLTDFLGDSCSVPNN